MPAGTRYGQATPWLICACVLFSPDLAHAWVIEDDIKVPVNVTTARGKEVAHEIRVALFHENSSPTPRPLLVLNHGRAAKGADRVKVNVRDFATAARWLTGFGFIVAVPVRVGYGMTGGVDVEDSGGCNSKVYPPVYKAAAVQTLAVLEAMRRRPDAAQDRAVVMGLSFGGTTAITVAAMDPPGVQGTINFAGGGGGNPVDRPHDPCGQPGLKRLFAGYGKTARMPTLWVYSENDRFFGPVLPREWFDAFKATGGTGEYAAFPPFREDGHQLFSRGPEQWQPRVREFLASIGYSPLNSAPKHK